MGKHLLAALLCLAIAAALCSGCGGGASSGATQAQTKAGALQFDIVWPTPSRVIPAAAQSLVIQITSGSQLVAKRIIPRPPAGTNTSSIRFDSLAPGVVTVLVTAYPNKDGTGVPQAIGGATVAIISGVTTQANVDPSSTVDHIDLVPNPLTSAPTHVKTLVPSPRDSQNAIVLVAPSSLKWTSNMSNVATVDGSGAVTAVALGDAVIRVVDTESGQTAAVDVHVVPPIVIRPAQVTVSIGDQVQFQADTADLASSNVTWSVQEGAAGGVIDSKGNYTAPAQSGTFHVIATSVSEPSISAVATVVVQSGSGTVIIR